jgi:hypothetical protein
MRRAWGWVTLEKTMTIDERLDRIEHVSAGSEEQRRKDRETDRALWRETQRQLNDLTIRIAEVNDNLAARIAQLAEEAAARDRETDRRFRETDARIDRMISTMGATSATTLPPHEAGDRDLCIA